MSFATHSLLLLQDIRDFSFDSLSGDNVPKKYVPSDQQRAAARDLINSLDLMSGSMDSNGNQMEALKPKHTFNPVLQHFYQSVQNRALNPQHPLTELDPVIRSYIQPDE